MIILKHSLKHGSNFSNSRSKYCDAILSSISHSQVSIPVHRIVLASVSKLFESLFDDSSADMKGTDSIKIITTLVEDVECNILEKVVDFIYSGEITIDDSGELGMFMTTLSMLQVDLHVIFHDDSEELSKPVKGQDDSSSSKDTISVPGAMQTSLPTMVQCPNCSASMRKGRLRRHLDKANCVPSQTSKKKTKKTTKKRIKVLDSIVDCPHCSSNMSKGKFRKHLIRKHGLPTLTSKKNTKKTTQKRIMTKSESKKLTELKTTLSDSVTLSNSFRVKEEVGHRTYSSNVYFKKEQIKVE
jgi:ssDNA-binding Zn-finger/Zn-ribbon topoisomerase 1